VQSQLQSAAGTARALGVKSTPSFLLSRTGGQPTRFSPAGLDAGSFSGPLDRLLGGR